MRLFFLLFTIWATAAPAASNFNYVGARAPGYYDASGDRIRYFAVEYQGARTYSEADAAAKVVYKALKSNNYTMTVTGQQFWRGADDRFLVLGWYNQDRDEYGWIAIEDTRSQIRWMSNFNSSTKVGNKGNWKVQTWKSNGMILKIQFGQDGPGRGVTWGFYVPS